MQHIYLSPHFDDAVYSCGGMIHRQARQGEPVCVLTVFAGDPAPGAVSPLAQRLHADWHQGADAARTRATEDAAALRVLGASGEHWDFRDAIYRRSADGAFLYPTFEDLFQSIHAADQSLIADLARRLQLLAAEGSTPTTFYVPLGVGGHVDHGIVRAAGEHLRAAGGAVLFYEDQPYAANGPSLLSGTLLAATAVWWQPTGAAIDLERKVHAMACYPSQSRGRLVAQVATYARRVGGAVGPAERLWQATPRAAPRAEDWATLLRCPRCNGRFRPAPAQWLCVGCAATYPIWRGVLDLRTVTAAQAALPPHSPPPPLARGATGTVVADGAALLARILQVPLRQRTGPPAQAGLALGCRSASPLLALATVSAHVVGIDASLSTLQRTRRLLEATGHAAVCLLVAADPETLPCHDHVFGTALVDSRRTVGAARPAVRLEVYRTLQPGGIFLFHRTQPFRRLVRQVLMAGLRVLPRRLRARAGRNLRNLGAIP